MCDFLQKKIQKSALLKQQGGGVKGPAKSAPVVEEVPPLLEGGGKLEV